MTKKFEEMIVELKEDIHRLEVFYDPRQMGATIRDMIKFAYGHYLIAILKSCIGSTDLTERQLAEQLTTILDNHWNVVRGSFLCYTSNPNSACTNVLLKLAQWVGDYQYSQGRFITLMSVVMPSIKQISTTRTHLDVVYYLDDGTSQQPYDVADFKTEIQSITDIDSLKQILCTHFLSKDGESLIPVSLLLELTLDAEKRPLIKPYVASEKEDDPSVQSIPTHPADPINQKPDSEFNRLINHTHLTRAILNAQHDYEAILSQNVGSLNNALRELGDGLYAGSSHGGEGKALNASEKAYAAIIKFMEYYNNLPRSVVNKIPKDVLLIIKKIQTLGSDRGQNDMTKITTNVQTCVGLMGGDVKTQLRLHEKELNKIGVVDFNDPKILKAINDAKLGFSKAKLTLSDAITNGTYVNAVQDEATIGSIDKLGPTIAVIKALGVKAIFDMNPDFLISGGTECLKQWMRPLTSEIQAQFYQEMGPYWPSIIRNINDCKDILDVVRGTDAALVPVVLVSLENHWPTIINSLNDFRAIEVYFGQNHAQIKALISIIRPKLLWWIYQTAEYAIIKKYLSHDEHLAFLGELEANKPALWLEIIKEPFFYNVKETISNSLGALVRRKLEGWFDPGITRLFKNNWKQVKSSVLSDRELEVVLTNAQEAEEEVILANMGRWRHPPFVFNKNKWIKEHIKQLITVKVAGLSKHFINQIDKRDILLFIQTLFVAHPWIKTDPSGAIIQSFLEYIILRDLTDNLVDETGNTHTLEDMNATQLLENSFRWKRPTLEWVKRHAQIYPYTTPTIFQKPLPNYPSLENHVKQSPENWINHAFSRIDVLRYLGRCMPEKMLVKYDADQQPYLPIKLILLSELNTLTPVDLKNTEYFLINIATEEEPLWIGLQRANNSILYIPGHPNADDIQPLIEQTLPDLRRVCPTLTPTSISYEHNLALNDFNPDLTSKTIWHTILFTRILAAKTNNPTTYRQYLPLYVLMQEFYFYNYVHSPLFMTLFLNRHPFSSNRVTELKATGYELLTSNFEGIEPITLFENGFDCTPNHNSSTYTLKATRSFSSVDLLSVLYLLHHSPQIQTLLIPAQTIREDRARIPTGLICALLDTNTALLEIGASDKNRTFSPLYRYLECITARNRLLHMFHPELIDIRTSISERKKLWLYAGQQLLNHFQDPAAKLVSYDLSMIDGASPLECLSKSQQIMRQWQAMGILGVKQLFNAINVSPDAPNLYITFDLRASNIEHPFQASNKRYITTVTELIKSYKGIAPLFQSVSLILPDSIDQASINELYQLVNSIKQQLTANPDKPNELFFYNVKLANVREILKPFEITKVTPDAAKHPIPRIPELDEAAVFSPKERDVKNYYRDIQNDGLRVWRQYASEAPINAMRTSITLLEKNQLPPTILLTNINEQETLSWGVDEVWTPLVGDFGTQIQVEMEQEQQHHVTTNYETKPVLKDEAPPIVVTPITLFYNKPKEILITRDNIDKDSRFTAWWSSLSPEQQAQYGGSGKALFASLFGNKQAEHLIAQVEFCALERLFPHIPQLLGGFDRDNLIAGFELALGKPKMVGQRRVRDIVLCFDLEKEKIALADYQSKGPKARNPYTLYLMNLPKVNYFLGNFCQFSTISADPFVQQTLYQFLATDEHSEKSLRCAHEHLKGYVLEEHLLVTQARFEFDKEIVPPGDHDLCLDFLKDWVNDPALDCLFDTKHNAHLTIVNLKSLGQLFYQFGSRDGLRNFFHLAHQIIDKEHFDEEGLINWKKYILDLNPNWSTCLDKEELEAISLSLSTLKGNSTAQKIWWLIVEAHVKTVGYSTYSSIWYAYQKCMGYLSERQLTLDVDVIASVLEERTPFNAQFFLEKLHVLLHTHAKTLDGHALSQQMLKHLEPSDVDVDGPIYAILYEHYPLTYKSLKLTNLTTTFKSAVPTYLVSWKPHEVITDPIAHALRYACLRGRFYHHELSKLESQLETHFKPLLNDPKSIQVLRIYIGCVTSGINAVDSIDHHADVSAILKLDPEILAFINRGMRLPDIVQKNSMKLDWHDIVTLANAISELDLLPLIENLTDFEAEAFINACGCAIRCYRYHAPHGSNYLYRLLDTIKTKTQLALDAFDESKEEGELQEFKDADTDYFQTKPQPDWEHPLLQHYPWLIITAYPVDDVFLERLNSVWLNEEQAQCLMLQKQLSTLQFEDTRYLPDLPALENAFDQINQANDPESTRRHIVSTWEKQGLHITLRDTKYCSLTDKEIIDAMVYLDNHLELNFKSQNKALCRRFLEKHLALPTKGNRQDEIITLLEQFCNQLDNKKHYNELGIILGHLINLAKPIDKTQSQKWYSAKQLADILQLLIHSDMYKTHHYPLSLLEIFLNAPIANTLISSDLNELEQAIKPADLRNYIQDLTDNKTMPLVCKEIALEYATRGDNNECRVNAELAKDLLTALSNDTRLKPSYLDMLNQFLKAYRLQAQDYATWQQKHVIAYRHITDKTMQSLWQDMQIKWETQLSEPIRALFASPVNAKQVYIQMILVQVLSKKELADDVDHLRQKLIPVKAQLSNWEPEELTSLIVYCFSDNRLTLSALHVLFTDFNSLFEAQLWQSLLKERGDIALEGECPIFNSRSATQVIHFFESVFMARGKAARHYSIAEDEQNELLRILSTIKRKERGYISPSEINQLLGLLGFCNAFAIAKNLAKLENTALKDLANTLALELSKGMPEADRPYLKMQILACIREMNLRKKSIWNNHSQMVALIYLAVYGDEIGIIQKIATGEGKSVVTPQRAIYLALSGKIVDIISAKDILSQRDSERDANLIQAFGFPVSHHITPGSPTEDYQKTDKNGGAIHYFNLGNFALFLCDVIASRHESFNLYSKNRVAILDEADYLILDELMLQYNYAKPQADAGIYNYDEWVFRAVCQFYVSHKKVANQETSFRMNESGQLCISNLRHLKPLGDYLQSLSLTAPKQSAFIKQTLIPALHDKSCGMQELERVLRQHLSACHSAYCLELDKHYYIGSATRKVGNMVINVRFPYVMIDSQPKEDSTYCNGTHQYLQTRLTLEAAEKGESPDFFVDPLSDIIFTLNPVSILNTLFEKREGSTGTPGSVYELRHYRSVHQIQEVIKMPTHQLSNSTRLPTCFAKDKEEQTTYIAEQIMANQDRPFLIDCENDADVKILSKAISTVCQTTDENYNPKQHFIVDTLDTGKSEDDILDEAGKNGSILWSARVSRGTDIKCAHEEGLFVIETGSKPKRKSKQVRGRQARHGDKGTVQAIIDFGRIQSQYDDWMNSPLKSKFEQLVEECREHLEKKIAKHAKDNTLFWRAFDESAYRERFLKTEAVESFKYRLNQENVMRDAQRNTLISNLSLEVTRVISRHNENNKTHEKIEHLEYTFSKLLIEIKELWNKHQRTTLPDDEQRLAFLNELNTSWIKFCESFADLGLNENAIQQEIQASSALPTAIQTVSNQVSEMAAVSELFNMVMSLLLERLSESFQKYEFEADATKTILGGSLELPYFADLAAYIRTLQALMDDPKRHKEIEDLLMMTLEIMNENTFFSVDFKTHRYILDQYVKIAAQEHSAVPESNERDTRPHILWLQGLTAFFKQPLLGQKPAGSRTHNEHLFIAKLTRLVVDTITTEYCYDSQALDFTDDPGFQFIETLCEELSNGYHPEFIEQINVLMDKLSLLLTQNETVTSLLTRHLIMNNRLPYIVQLLIQDNRADFDNRMRSFQDNVLMRKKKVSIPVSDSSIPLQIIMEPNRLEDYPGVIPLLFDIVFRNNEYGTLNSADLPAICPSCFDEDEPEKNITDFWIILAKHSPTSKQHRDAFINALAIYDKPHDRKNLLHALKEIPDSVHLSHINELIKNPTPSNVDGMLANIHLYTKQSNVWFDVLKAKNLVIANGNYWRPNFERQAEYEHLSSVFHQLSPDDSEYFFSNATFCSFATNEMELLATTFLNHQVTGNRLERCEFDAICDLFKLIKASPSQHQATLEAIFKDDLPTPRMLYQNRTRFKQFLNALSTLPNANPIDQTTIKHLWVMWRDKAIPEITDLERVVGLLKTIQSHHAKPQKMRQFFDSHVSQHIINERIFLIQCLNQKLIKISTRTMDDYYVKLKNLVNSYTATQNDIHLPQQQQSYFRNLFHLIQQLFLMNQPLFKKPTANVQNQNRITVNPQDRTPLLEKIKNAKTAYDYCFFQSFSRRAMAKNFFINLECTAFTNEPIEISMIKKILLVKEATLLQAGDKSWWSLFGRGPIDSKGYSRFYTITSGLLSSVTQIYLQRIAREPISEIQKDIFRQELFLVLKDHYIKEMEQLIAKLNTIKKCPQLSQLLSEIKNGLTDEHLLTTEQSKGLNTLIHTSKKEVPSYLHYIMDEMLILCDFADVTVGPTP